jgi:hypothetical protein
MRGMIHKSQQLIHWKIKLGGSETNSEIQVETSCFIGFEYECSKGHRFFLDYDNTKKIMPKTFSNKITRENFANFLVSSLLPILVNCHICSNKIYSNQNKNSNNNINTDNADAQLMRLYFTTPNEKGFQMKLNPKLQISTNKFKYVYDFCSYENDLTLPQLKKKKNYIFNFIFIA